MIPVSEQQLVQDLKAKRPAAFTQLYDQYSPALFGIILRLVKEQELAEDLLHDAFIKIWANMNSFNADKGRLFTWLVTLTQNVVIDELRAQKHQPQVQTYQNDHAPITDGFMLSDKLIDKSLLQQLSPVHRQVVELRYYKDYTQ